MDKQELLNQFDDFENNYGYSMDYARNVVAADPDLYVRFYEATQIGQIRTGLSESAWYTAQLVSLQLADCGACLQLVVTMAERAGISPQVIAQVVRGDSAALPDDERICAEFCRGVLLRSTDLPEKRAAMQRRVGAAGLVSAAYAMIASSMYPTLKYALGHGYACHKIEVDGHLISPLGSAL